MGSGAVLEACGLRDHTALSSKQCAAPRTKVRHVRPRHRADAAPKQRFEKAMASLYEEELAAASDGGGFQVYPKKSTPHLDCISTDALDGAKALAAVCARCGEDEVWICLQCHEPLCSRYKNGCAKKHAEESNHHIAVSLSDLSVWDFGQDSTSTSTPFRNCARPT